MDYETAKTLKENGFPQHRHDFDHDFKCMSVGAEGVDMCFPTLSELIEACGEEFSQLNRWKDEGGVFWKANNFRSDGVSEIEMGSTPEEAVAKLWIALQDKN